MYSRLPATLNPHLASGFQDFEAARIVYEPLASYDANGQLIPILAAEIPTVENQGIAADGRSVIWKLRQNVVWSDGQPFTAADVVFTYEFIRQPQVAAVTAQYYETLAAVEALDDHRVKLTFKEPTPAWQLPFTGQNGMILPKHGFTAAPGSNRWQSANLVGTGPYRLITQTEGRWLFAPNERFREGLPTFRLVELQGGVAPYVAARAVLQTGQADFAHNLQLEAAALSTLAQGEQGAIVPTFGGQVERVMINFTDPNRAAANGEKSSLANPHPFLTELPVRQAINYAIDRDAIANQLYGALGQPTAQLLVAPPAYASSRISYAYQPDKAKALLDQAGWRDSNGNGIRDKAGTELSLKFQSPVNTVRQQTQEMIKANLAAIGIAVELDRVRIDDFFSADPAQPRSLNHFYADLQEYATGNDTPDPIIYMSWWTCAEIASQANNWQKPNNARYCNPDYDALWEAARSELDLQRRVQLFQQMDELLAADVAVLPIVHRALVNGFSKQLSGYQPTPWDASTWDIGRWRRLAPPTPPPSAP
jgi:peptide/nickel transport system substrate-binding protein